MMSSTPTHCILTSMFIKCYSIMPLYILTAETTN